MKPKTIIVGTLVPSILAGHIAAFEHYCEPNCDWWHPEHIEIGEGSSGTMINSLVMPAAVVQTTST